ncbi:MAG: peptidase C1 [Ignavibacteriae bacterium]|nr:peptidase C1 [Ignavibacteriota bacterium]
MKNYFILILISLLFAPVLTAQNEKNKGEFIESKSDFYENMTGEIQKFNEPVKEVKKAFKMDFTGMDLPKSLGEFKYLWHNPPVSQGMTGTCWSFSATSYFETEIYRIHKREVKLSPIYTAYWEYVEKTRRFIRERGNSAFAEGSEANALPRIWKKYGIVPLEAYSGMLPGQVFHDHSKLIEEMTNYLNFVKKNSMWNEEEAVATIKDILNHYLGEPPSKFSYEGKEFTPKEFFENVVELNLDDYLDVVSYMQEPFYKQVEYKVTDNWWHSKDYYNVPVDVFMTILKTAIRNGYTLAIGGDVSEAGYDSRVKCAVVPTFDIPSDYIDDYSRQFRFTNGTTGDDHGLHLVGYMTKNGKDWFLIKDSGAGSKNVEPKGYYFYHEDYVKLKIMDFMIHRDAFETIFDQYEKNKN